ncbi:MAG: hypothetical protein K0S47_510 [Herbinix sp.]|jgi:hypothetical protein|nr:hypothetical protein [Herbinix sp.]
MKQSRKVIHKAMIIDTLRERLEPLSYVYAMWLEGADASGLADEYSDIDLYIDFEDEYEQQVYEVVEKTLIELAPIDYQHNMNHPHPKLRQRVYHLMGTSEFMMIDFCYQLHSREKEEYIYIEGNLVESAKVIFDKADIIRFQKENKEAYEKHNAARLEECRYRYTQHCRVLKYVRRRQYLEAYAYYNRYVLEPLIDLLRLIHTPANADYYLLHISHHIPKEDKEKLETFAQIASIEDIEGKLSLAKNWFEELLERYQKKDKHGLWMV